MKYWKEKKRFKEQTELLEALFTEQQKRYRPGGDASISFETLGDKQRKKRSGCVYFAGGRIDSKFCLGTQNTGLLHSALPTDYPKAIRPGFHSDHAELILCTHGEVVLEYAADLSSDASVFAVRLQPGEWFLAEKKCPHKISLSPLRDWLIEDKPRKDIPKAGFLAVKMGSLTGKNEDEDMGRWDSSTRPHRLTTIWQQDKEFLEKLCGRADLCKRLRIGLPELKSAVRA